MEHASKYIDTLHQPARKALEHDPAPSINVLDSNQPKRPKQAASAATTGEKRSKGANGNSGLIQMVSYYECSYILPTFRIRKAQNGFWRRIINRFLGCRRFRWTRGRNKGEMNVCNRTRRYARILLKNRLDKRDVPSFRNDGWWNARLRGRDAIGWSGE